MLFDKTEYQGNGFQPKDIPTTLPKLVRVKKTEAPVDDKVKCIKRIIRKCKSNNIKLFVCFPPNLLTYEQKIIPCIKVVNDLCSHDTIPCFIDYNNEEYLNHPELFYDNGHVNKNGASQYSRMFASRLKQVLNKPL